MTSYLIGSLPLFIINHKGRKIKKLKKIYIINKQKMDFPNFENINENHNNDNLSFSDHQEQGQGGRDEVQIESMEFNDNKYKGFDDNYNLSQSQNANFNNSPWENAPVSEMNFGQSGDDGLDEQERIRIQERKEEEEQRRAKIMKKMNDELRIKQDWRDKAVEFIENWRR